MLVVSPDRFLRQKCSDTPSPCVSPDPQGSCAVPFVSADRAAVATQSRCRDGQEPALARRISANPKRMVVYWSYQQQQRHSNYAWVSMELLHTYYTKKGGKLFQWDTMKT